MTRSRYREAGALDYSHRFHAGNVGDVWKHVVLVEVLHRLAAALARVVYVDTHAGEGGYPLGPTGEWTEGIGRLWDGVDDAPQALGRYLDLCRRLGGGGSRPQRYPGSPLLARTVLGLRAQMVLVERDADAAARLREVAGDDDVVCGDGLAVLREEVEDREGRADAVVVLVDPPWNAKADWIAVPDALVDAVRHAMRACFVLWYPVKSLTRPNAMHARLGKAGVRATIAELVTTPLERSGKRLNGSGVLLVRPPAGTVEAVAAAAPVIGERCATHGTWSLRVVAG